MTYNATEGEAVPLYDIAGIAADGEIHPVPGETIASLYAPTGRDALAQYSLAAGFADPRDPEVIEQMDGYDFFTEWPEGIWTMVFTNTELIATRREEN